MVLLPRGSPEARLHRLALSGIQAELQDRPRHLVLGQNGVVLAQGSGDQESFDLDVTGNASFLAAASIGELAFAAGTLTLGAEMTAERVTGARIALAGANDTSCLRTAGLPSGVTCLLGPHARLVLEGGRTFADAAADVDVGGTGTLEIAGGGPR